MALHAKVCDDVRTSVEEYARAPAVGAGREGAGGSRGGADRRRGTLFARALARSAYFIHPRAPRTLCHCPCSPLSTLRGAARAVRAVFLHSRVTLQMLAAQ